MYYSQTKEVLDEVLRTGQVQEGEVDLLVVVGSQVYGLAGPESDVDFLMVTKEPTGSTLILQNNIDIVVKSRGDFLSSLDSGSVFSFEGLFTPPEFSLLRKLNYARSPDRKKVAESALERSRSDYKKGTRTNDPKKVFHSIRVLDFAHQILTQGSIRNFKSVNYLYEEILTSPDLSLTAEAYSAYEKRVTDEV